MDGDASFGHWITLRRKALRLSCVEVARRVGCATVTLRKIEADERRPSQQIAARLADHLNVTPQERSTFIKVARGELGVHQLAHPDQIADYSSLAARAPLRTKLPIPPTALVGRAQEVAAVRDYLMRAEVRLLTLVGAPGIGKTRLALQAALELRDAFADGVAFIALAPIRDPDLLITTIAQALAISELPGQPLLERLQTYLRARQMLLVLDNLEQVLKAAPQLGELLAAAPRLTLLVTSRMALHLSGEQRFAVPPLALPDLLRLTLAANLASTLAHYTAIELFVQRARAAVPTFAVTDTNALAVAEICQRLDGLPLAIELAAARIALFTPSELLERLDQRLSLLTTGAVDLPTRQQTLRRALAWSHDLLDDGEQRLFRRLGVFVGGCTLDAAEAVCGGWELGAGGWDNSALTPNPQPLTPILDGVAALIDQSLLQRTEGTDGRARFTMLETIREYALERLAESGELETVRRQHLGYYLALVEQARSELDGAQQRAWLDRLRQDYDNLRAALSWIIEQDAADLGLRLVRALGQFWFLAGYISEGRRWATALVARARAAWPAEFRAQALQAAGSMTWQHGDYAAALEPLEESAAIYRQLGDKRSLAGTLNPLGRALLFQGEHERARTILEECTALSQEVGDHAGLALSLHGRAYVAMDQADYLAARALLEQSLPIYRTLRNQWGIAQTLDHLGDLARCAGDYEQAAALYQQSLSLFQAQGIQVEIAAVLHNLGYVTLAQGDQQRARAHFVESLALHREQGNRPGILEALAGFGALLAAQGQPRRAAILFGAIAALRAALSAPMWPAERVEFERHMASVRIALGEGALQAALAEGGRMTFEDAIAYALRSTDTTA